MRAYREDLAYIHDVGYSDFARSAPPSLLAMLRRHGIMDGCVIDLGCGPGTWARSLSDAGYRVLGIDISPAMIAIARQRVPDGTFRTESLFGAHLPPCVSVTALGECFNYLFDQHNNSHALRRLFRRIHRSLCPNGLLIFDVAEPGRIAGSGTRHQRKGQDWAVLVSADEDPRRKVLTRRITTFRKVGDVYRRREEIHRLRLYTRAEVTRQLREVGFRVHVLPGYGQTRFPRGLVGFLARKP